MKKSVCIVGGGASGIMAAIGAARSGACVTLLEHQERIGKKILLTGNGKCNVTNLDMTPQAYNILGKNTLPELVLAQFDAGIGYPGRFLYNTGAYQRNPCGKIRKRWEKRERI